MRNPDAQRLLDVVVTKVRYAHDIEQHMRGLGLTESADMWEGFAEYMEGVLYACIQYDLDEGLSVEDSPYAAALEMVAK